MHSSLAPLAFVALFGPFLGLVACGGASSAPASPGAGDGKHPIVLHREAQPGKSYHLRIKDESTEHTVIHFQAKPDEETKTTTLSFVGTVQALAAGRDQPSDYTVEELTRTENGVKRVLLPAGAKISARADGKHWKYSADGAPAAEELANSLKTLLGDTVGGATYDDIFGSKLPRAIGESWPVNVAQFPPDENVEFDPKGASGSIQLLGRRARGGVDCLELEAGFTVPNVRLKGLPPEGKVLSAGMTGRFGGAFPLDTKLPAPNQTLALDVKVQLEIASPQGAVPVDMTVHGEHTQICE